MERPEDRSFKRNLEEYVPAHRGQLAAAILTIVRAYQVSGDRMEVLPYGGFEHWSRLIREPLIWLGMEDPLKTRDLIRAKNPELDQLGTILEAWHKAHGDKPLTINDAIKEDSVRIACFAVEPGEGGKPNARAIGKLLGRHEGRVVHGLRIDQAGKRQNYVVWRVSREP